MVKLLPKVVASRSRGRPSPARSRELTTLIVSLARETFLTLGYADTSIDLIVQKARISKRTFYTRFANKEELFQAVCRQFVEERFVATGVGILKSGALAQRLEAVALHFLEQALQPETTTFHRNLLVIGSTMPEVIAAAQKATARLDQAVACILDQAVAAGELRPMDTLVAGRRFLDGTVSRQVDKAHFGLRGPAITEADKAEVRDYVEFFIRGYQPVASKVT